MCACACVCACRLVSLRANMRSFVCGRINLRVSARAWAINKQKQKQAKGNSDTIRLLHSYFYFYNRMITITGSQESVSIRIKQIVRIFAPGYYIPDPPVTLFHFLKTSDRVMIEFLDGPSHLYKRVCPSVDPSVGP